MQASASASSATGWTGPKRPTAFRSPIATERFVESVSKNFQEFPGEEAFGKAWLSTVVSKSARYAGSDSIEQPYAEAAWVHVALKAISSAVRSCPLRFYREDPKENPKAKPVSVPRLERLFKRPNPYMNGMKFMEAAVLHRKLDGENLWFLFNDKKYPVDVGEDGMFDLPDMIVPIRGSQAEHKTGKHGFIEFWKYPGANGGLMFPVGSVIHFCDYDPSNPLRGLGDVQVLLRDLALEFNAQRYLEAMLRNSGDPGGYILSENEMGREEEEAAQQDADQAFGPERKGRWKVISGKGIKYEAAKFGPKDMEFERLMDHVAEKTAAVCGVPLPVMGKLDEATYSNYGTAVAQFWQAGNGVLSFLASEEETINQDFLAKLRGREFQGLIARFDTSKVEALKDDNSDKLKLAVEISRGEVGVSFDEACGLTGMRDIETEYGKHPWLAPNRTTAEEALTFAEEQIENGRNPAALGDGGDAPGGSADGETPFPGSNDGESGSNGPTGSDGKAATQEERDRQAYWLEYRKGVQAPAEERLRGLLKNYLRDYHKAQMKRLRAFAQDGWPIGARESEVVTKDVSPDDIVRDPEMLNVIVLDLTEWVEKLARKIGVPLEDLLEASAEDMAGQLGGSSISRDDPWAMDTLRAQKTRITEGVNSTLAKKVREVVVNVFKDKPFDIAPLQQHIREALPELEGRLSEVFTGRSMRANTIARTEVNRAANSARMEVMRREGVERHQWITSGDEFVRDKHPHSHRQLDGVVRNIGESFREGWPLRHPGDPDAPPQDVVNCRCVARPIVKD